MTPKEFMEMVARLDTSDEREKQGASADEIAEDCVESIDTLIVKARTAIKANKEPTTDFTEGNWSWRKEPGGWRIWRKRERTWHQAGIDVGNGAYMAHMHNKPQMLFGTWPEARECVRGWLAEVEKQGRYC